MAVTEQELSELARDELDLARRMSWRELIRVTPWSDAYVAMSGSGSEVEIERSYIWVDDTRQAIRVEVWARSLDDPQAEALQTATATPEGFE